MLSQPHTNLFLFCPLSAGLVEYFNNLAVYILVDSFPMPFHTWRLCDLGPPWPCPYSPVPAYLLYPEHTCSFRLLGLLCRQFSLLVVFCWHPSQFNWGIPAHPWSPNWETPRSAQLHLLMYLQCTWCWLLALYFVFTSYTVTSYFTSYYDSACFAPGGQE